MIVLTDKAKKTDKIRRFNDRFRTTFQAGQVMVTCGVNALPPYIQAQIIAAVRAEQTFSSDNDPHLEHDFGSFDVQGHAGYWKIDYYDQTMEYGAEDPADDLKTKRVLTIMLREEY